MERMKEYGFNVMNYYSNKGRFIPHSIYKEIKQRTKCRDCGRKKKKESFEIHHIIPISKGGTNLINNLILLCPVCHKKRHNNEL